MPMSVKRLTRSRRDRVFGGICGGLASYLGWDVVLVRVAWVVLTVLSAGSGVVLYLLAWLIIPLEEPDRAEVSPEGEPPPVSRPRRRLVRIHRGRKIAGVCNGMGVYFGVDPTAIRLLWIALVLAFGAGILLYLLFWIAMPLVENPPDELTS